jgi:hypothetical protein
MAADNRLSLDQAIQRLGQALDRLESAALRRAEGARAAALADEAADALRQDRAQLAADLDRALLRATQLEEACSGASRRVDQAIGSVRGLLTRAGREES